MRLDKKQVEQRLVLLHEDADAVEEGHKSSADVRLRRAFARPKKSTEGTKYLLMDEDRLARAGKYVGEESKQRHSEFAAVHPLAHHKEVDAFDDVFAQEECEAVARSPAGLGILPDEQLCDGSKVLLELGERKRVDGL